MRAPLILLVGSLALGARGQEPAGGPYAHLMTLTGTTTARVSSYDVSGGNADYRAVPPGATLELARIGGAGIVRHLYFSIWGGPHYLRDLVLRAYWDGSDTPCVEVPFGDFFGLGHERPRFYSSLMITVNPGDLGVFGTFGFNSYFPMPFANGARFTLTNEGGDPVNAVWYHIEYERMDELPPRLGRFHSIWNRVNPTAAIGPAIDTTLHAGINATGEHNYVLLDAAGHGSVVGLFLNVDNRMGGWYGEGDDMIFIDGERWPPSYHGTGSEEIFGGGACPTREYAGPYTGFHLIGNPDYTGKTSMYRFYLHDPIRFRRSIRMSLEHGHANNIANDYSSTVFWYQSEPHKPFAPLPAASARRPQDGDDPHDRAYRKLAALREPAFRSWIGSVRSGVPLPSDLTQSLKQGVSETYFRRDYDRLTVESEALARRLEELRAE
jgi:hypothetical protein